MSTFHLTGLGLNHCDISAQHVSCGWDWTWDPGMRIAVSASSRPFTNHGADTVSISGSKTDLVDGHLCKGGGRSQMRKTSCAWFDSIWRSRWQCQMLHRKIEYLRIKHWAFSFQQSANWKGIYPHVETELGLKHTIEPGWYTAKQSGCEIHVGFVSR